MLWERVKSLLLYMIDATERAYTPPEYWPHEGYAPIELWPEVENVPTHPETGKVREV
jgi:hypothetical protein